MSAQRRLSDWLLSHTADCRQQLVGGQWVSPLALASRAWHAEHLAAAWRRYLADLDDLKRTPAGQAFLQQHAPVDAEELIDEAPLYHSQAKAIEGRALAHAHLWRIAQHVHDRGVAGPQVTSCCTSPSTSWSRRARQLAAMTC